MKKQIAICDSDARYRQSLQSYLMKRLPEYEVHIFANLSETMEYSGKQGFAILLVSEQALERTISKVQALQIFVLRENGKSEIQDYPYVDKYQSVEQLIREVFEEYAKHSLREEPAYRCYQKTRLHAFYSPIGQQEQTLCAFTLGQLIVQQEKKVLYLNLQAFAGQKELFLGEQAADITDLLYFAGKGEGNLSAKLQGMKQTLGGVDYLAPAQDGMDLLQVTKEEWLTLLERVMEWGEYSDVILDLSEICQGLYQILEKSDVIYSINGRTKTQQYSVERYQKLLQKRDMEAVLEKTIWLDLPQLGTEREQPMERLVTTPLGEYMKGQILHGNKQV